MSDKNTNDDKVRTAGDVSSRSFLKKLIFSVVVVLVLIAAAIVFHNRILDCIGSFMAIHDPLEKSDLILAMNDEAHTIPFAVLDLYQNGYAPKIALADYRPTRLEQAHIASSQSKAWRNLFVSKGVPIDKIDFVGSDLKNNVELGKALADYAKTNNIKTVIVVGSSPFTRLARYDLSRGLTGQPVTLRMCATGPRYFDEHDWWHARQGWISYFDAYYLMLLHRFRD